MKRSVLIALGSAIVLAWLAVPANAQATRIWVSGVGTDANPCTRTAPCLTFAGAVAKTPANGIIVCMDPGEFGAGALSGTGTFAPVTITQSMTIDCEQTTGSFLVPTGNGITVTGSGIVVNLRGLAIDGLGTGAIGINITQAATVYVRKSVIYGFQAGAATGIGFSGGGTLVVNDTVVHSNGTGIAVSGGGNVGMTLRDVIVHGNSANGVSIATSGSSAKVTIDHSTLAFNGGAGLNVNGSAAIAMIGNSTVTGNATGVAAPSGTLYSFKENQIAGNTTDGTPITAFPGPGGPLQ